MLESRDSGASPYAHGEDAGIPPEGDIAFRAMTVEDLPEVTELERACFADPWSRAAFESELRAAPTSWCRVMRVSGGLVGYMIAWFIEDEAHLANIAVSPPYRRRGFAQWMIDRLMREAYMQGSRMIILEVRASNAGAIALYERNGFTAGGIRKNYYNHPREDAVVMIRSLRL